jgi:hypothetical protein
MSTKTEQVHAVTTPPLEVDYSVKPANLDNAVHVDGLIDEASSTLSEHGPSSSDFETSSVSDKADLGSPFHSPKSVVQDVRSDTSMEEGEISEDALEAVEEGNGDMVAGADEGLDLDEKEAVGVEAEVVSGRYWFLLTIMLLTSSQNSRSRMALPLSPRMLKFTGTPKMIYVLSAHSSTARPPPHILRKLQRMSPQTPWVSPPSTLRSRQARAIPLATLRLTLLLAMAKRQSSMPLDHLSRHVACHPTCVKSCGCQQYASLVLKTHR